jgi:energy-coupling factor transport system ATP-binding protein
MAIKIFDLFHTYNAKTDIENVALRGLNLELNDHFFAALVGKTGSGKSTLAQHLNYLLKPTSGSIKVNNFEITSNKKQMKKFKTKELRKTVGYLFQFSENQIFSDTVLKEVMFGPKNFGIKDEELKNIAMESLKKVNIDESFYERSPIELSGGEKRRIAIASVLASKPDILILDEPTVGLDPVGKEDLLNLLKEIQEKTHKSIVMITHDMDNVARFAKRVIVMNKAEIAFDGTPQELFNNDEILESYNLDLPECAKYAKALKEKGLINYQDIPLTKEKLLEVIKEAYHE